MPSSWKQTLKNPESAKKFTTYFIEGYLNPAFGARSKPEIDLLVLGALIEADALDPAGPIYDLARALNITPTRARTLIHNWQLRNEEFRQDLSKPLIRALQKTKFSKDGSLLTFGIESPLLREEMFARLKSSGIFADMTFARDIIRMPVKHFVYFLDGILDSAAKEKMVDKLVASKHLVGTDFKSLVVGAMGKFGEKVAGEAGNQIAGEMVDQARSTGQRLTSFLSILLAGKTDQITEIMEID